MALYDLSPEQRQQVEAFLMQPPPAQFASASLPQGGATPNIPPETLLKAQMGLLGSQGRVIQQMAFQNERRQLEARAADVARQIQSVNPLDPEREVKLSRIAASYPQEFASSVVQQSLGLNEAQRRQALGAEQEMQRQMDEQMKRQQEAQAAALAARVAGLDPTSPEALSQITSVVSSNPLISTAPPVQQALQLFGQRRSEAKQQTREKQAEEQDKADKAARLAEDEAKRQAEAEDAQLYAWMQSQPPEKITEGIAQFPGLFNRNRSAVESTLARKAEAQAELDYLPAYKAEALRDKPPAAIRAEATKFTNSLPKPLRTLAQPDREEAVRLAQELKAARAAEATAQEGTEPDPVATLPSDAIATRLTGLLGVEELDNSTVEALTESRAKVLGASDYLPPSARARLYEKLPK